MYRFSPSSVNELIFKHFISEFSDLLYFYASDTSRKIFIGDSNIHANKPDDSEVRQYLELLCVHGLVQLVDEPTHKSGNILDHIVRSSDDVFVSSIDVVPEAAISDHYSAFFHLNLKSTVSPDPRRSTITYKKMKDINPAPFASKFSQIPDTISLTDTINHVTLKLYF